MQTPNDASVEISRPKPPLIVYRVCTNLVCEKIDYYFDIKGKIEKRPINRRCVVLS